MMDELTRSPEIEADLIRAAVKAIRDRERAVAKRYDCGKYVTYWDADDARLRFRDMMIPLTGTTFGTDVVLTTQRRNPDGKRIYLLMEHVVDLQFAPKEHLEMIFLTRDVFEHDGGVRLSDFASPGADAVRKFCIKMDQIILAEVYKLRDQGVTLIFDRMHSEMGGEAIPEQDRVGRRIRYFRDLADQYRANKQKWRSEMAKHQLIK